MLLVLEYADSTSTTQKCPYAQLPQGGPNSLNKTRERETMRENEREIERERVRPCGTSQQLKKKSTKRQKLDIQRGENESM